MELIVFLFNCEKKNSPNGALTSLFLVLEQNVLLCSLEIPLFSSYELTCLNVFEFILSEKTNLGKIRFYNPQMDQ